jgi:homoserine acetyltransferase
MVYHCLVCHGIEGNLGGHQQDTALQTHQFGWVERIHQTQKSGTANDCTMIMLSGGGGCSVVPLPYLAGALVMGLCA